MVYLVLFPVFLHFLVFQLFPLAFSFVIGLMDWPIIGQARFVGLDNWREFLSDRLAWKALWNTTLFSVYFILPTMASGMFLAFIANTGLKGVGFFKGIYFLPVVTSFVAICLIWIWMFSGSERSLMNSLLLSLGIPARQFFGDPGLALPALASVSIFKMAGSTMIYYLAGLQSIPAHLYEAAEIDGATGVKKFVHITFPMLAPIHFYVAITTTIASFQVFDSAYLITKGGPNYSTTTLVYYVYHEGFTNLRLGYASALSFVLFGIILIVSLIQRKMIGKESGFY